MASSHNKKAIVSVSTVTMLLLAIAIELSAIISLHTSCSMSVVEDLARARWLIYKGYYIGSRLNVKLADYCAACEEQ